MDPVFVDYSTFLALVSSKRLLIQYREDPTAYMIFAPEDGAAVWQTTIAKDGGANQIDFEANYKPTANAKLVKDEGNWSYYSGTSGTVNVSAGQRVIGIGAHATNAGSFTINGGSSIPVPANVGISINPLANITAPTIIFTGTDSYFVEAVS